jgi:hypothetical protein
MFLHGIFHAGQVVHRTGPSTLVGKDHIFQPFGVLYQLGDIYHPGNIRTAITDKNTDSDFFAH